MSVCPCRRLGYRVSADGQVEAQDKFLRRVAGLTRLYAALIITQPPPTSAGPPTDRHPHGVERAWAWLGHVMSVEPRQDVTATLLHEFLAVTADSMSRVYGRQFSKLVGTLYTDYLPRIAALSPASGPVSRLDSLLKSCIAGRIRPPAGQLTAAFWHT